MDIFGNFDNFLGNYGENRSIPLEISMKIWYIRGNLVRMIAAEFENGLGEGCPLMENGEELWLN